MMDERALGQLLNRHGAALVLYARQWCATPEDAVQEAFLKLATLGSLPPAPLPWLFCAVKRQALSAARSAQRRRRHEREAAAHAEAWFVPGSVAALDAELVTAALPQLAPEPREAITLHIWGGLSFAEIAAVLDCSTSSAHRHYQAGLQQLRERIEPCPTPHPTTLPPP
jgi:RNA polymerase sigma factor (sigma-70 family)